MGFKSKKDNNSEKEKKIEESKKLEISGISIDGEEVKNISYFQLFRYAGSKEKFMIFFGILGSIIQGATLPAM